MNLNIFVPLNLEKISQLKFIEKTVPFMFNEAKDSPTICGAVHMVSHETSIKLSDLFKGKDDVKINKDDKVYVFPGCKIPQFKIKEGLKELGAKFTSNWEEATVYLGSELAFKSVQQRDFSVNLLGGSYYNCFMMCSSKKKDVVFENAKYEGIYEDPPIFYVREAWSSITSETGKFKNGARVNNFTMLTLLGAEIVHRKLAHKISIISEDAFLAQLKPTCTIDHTMYETLNDMLKSHDDENNQLALQTISNCNIEESKKYIYLLVKYHYEQFKYTRFKNIKLFAKMIKLEALYKLDVKDFIIELMKDGKDNIGKDVAKQLFDIEADAFINDNSQVAGNDISLQSNLFDIILVPKDKFKAIVPDLTYKYELDDEK